MLCSVMTLVDIELWSV